MWWNFLSTHTVPVGRAQVEAGCAEMRGRGSAPQLLLQPLGTHPSAQAIIVNDKVTIEVIIVLN